MPCCCLSEYIVSFQLLSIRNEKTTCIDPLQTVRCQSFSTDALASGYYYKHQLQQGMECVAPKCAERHDASIHRKVIWEFTF